MAENSVTIKVVHPYKDKYTGVYHPFGEILAVSEERAVELTDGPLEHAVRVEAPALTKKRRGRKT